MNLDTVFHKGSVDKPAIIFVHGLGMDKSIWVNPSESRILGGRFPLKILLSKSPNTIQTLFDDLRFRGYPVITWSQERPAGPIDFSVAELKEIVRIATKMTKDGIVLIGHSRGGLIGRKYLLRKDRSIRSLITISTPHKGSSIAKIANYLSPLISVIDPLFPYGDKGTLSFTIRRVIDFLRSKALKELLPESHLFKSLKDGPLNWIYYISVGGTDPTLFSLYNFSIPEVLEKVVPKNLYPEEIKKGKGDGLVSAESSRIPWCNEHHNFGLNHAQILFDKGVRDMIIKSIERFTSALSCKEDRPQ
ncbi:MAG: alpha/beta fold hydrolase [Nitrospirae bacterium]|nr:alpha/beta fold hydrolase [Nitrospirota bacterium]